MMLVLLKLLSVLILVLANGFFVAVEFALVSVRRARIETLAASGKRGAAAVLRALDHLDSMLSASQFGITIASLALGAVGESTLAHLLEPVLLRILPGSVSALVAHSVGIAIALAVITYFHLVLGEYAPKALAIEKAEWIALRTARWMELFYQTFKPFIWLINVSGIKFLKLFGVNFRPGHHTVYTEEELRYLINVSHESGHLEKDEKELIHNVFEFGSRTAREIMIPRTEVTAIEEQSGFAEVVRQFQGTRYSRLPVYSEKLDEIVGVVYIKDFMPFLLKPEEFRLSQVMRSPIFIPDTARLGDVLEHLQKTSVHLAIVVDEHGGMKGILTLEDLLEEIVGEIQDEHDDAIARSNTHDKVFSIHGGMPVRDANRSFELNIAESDDYNTMAGFLMAKAGRLLKVNDTLEHEGLRLTVERVIRHRIAQIRVERIAETSESVIEPLIEAKNSL